MIRLLQLNLFERRELVPLLKGEPPGPVVTGPRQSGKSTLVRHAFPDHRYVSLEDLDQREFAETDPRGFLNQLTEGVLLDEAQHCPALFSYLQTRVDERQQPG